jgi:hypothetical protein
MEGESMLEVSVLTPVVAGADDGTEHCRIETASADVPGFDGFLDEQQCVVGDVDELTGLPIEDADLTVVDEPAPPSLEFVDACPRASRAIIGPADDDDVSVAAHRPKLEFTHANARYRIARQSRRRGMMSP